jgi:hypothetical protein
MQIEVEPLEAGATRDKRLVRFIGRHGIVSCGHVMREFQIGRTAAYRLVKAYKDRGLLGRDTTLRNEQPVLYATREGLRWTATREQLTAAVERKRAEVQALCDAAEREAQQAAERLARVKRDYTHGELTVAEWRELRADLASELDAAQAQAERLHERLRSVEADTAVTDVETELLEQLARIRAAGAGEITDAAGVAAVRSALLRLFDGFVLHRDVPEQAHVELIGEYWIEPIVSQQAIEGYDEKLRPVLARKPLEQAENNYAEALLL